MGATAGAAKGETDDQKRRNLAALEILGHGDTTSHKKTKKAK